MVHRISLFVFISLIYGILCLLAIYICHKGDEIKGLIWGEGFLKNAWGEKKYIKCCNRGVLNGGQLGRTENKWTYDIENRLCDRMAGVGLNW